MDVERETYRVYKEPPKAPWDTVGTFDTIYQVAKAKGIEVEF